MNEEIVIMMIMMMYIYNHWAMMTINHCRWWRSGYMRRGAWSVT